MDDNVRIFHMANGGLLIGSALRSLNSEWTVSRPMIVSLRPNPADPKKMQIMMQKMIGDPQEVTVRETHNILDYAPGDKQIVTEYLRLVTGIELATEMPKGKS